MTLARSVDQCVRCGFCLPACPTYRLFDDEESSPRGRIALVRAIEEGTVLPTADSLATFDECLGCRACESACPSGVLYEEVFLRGRELLAEVSPRLPWHVRLLLLVLASPRALIAARGAWRVAGRALAPMARRFRSLPPPLTLLIALPTPSAEPITPQHRPEVAVHRGCIMDVLWEGTNGRAVALLRDAGMTADTLPLSAGCCGALHAHQGDRATARRLARRVIEAFETSGADRLINLAGGCSAFVREYPDLFETGDPWKPRAERTAEAVTDAASLLAERGWIPPERNERVTYQDSCHLRHGLKIWREPRALLRDGSRYCEMESADQCCGSAGIYNLLRPDVSNQLIGDKVAEVEAMGVDEVIVSNPGCELQWRMGLRQAGSRIRVRHIVDYLSGHEIE